MIAPLIKHVPSGVAAARPCTSGSHSCRASAYDESSRPSDRAIRMVLTADHNLTIANTGRSLGRGVLSHSSVGNRRGFAGYVEDPPRRIEESPRRQHDGVIHELCHVRHRAYHADLGRFLQRDPAGYADGPNLYEYVAGEPVVFVDPFGLEKGATGLCYVIPGQVCTPGSGHDPNAPLAPDEPGAGWGSWAGGLGDWGLDPGLMAGADSFSQALRQCATTPSITVKIACYEQLYEMFCSGGGAPDSRCAGVLKAIKALKETIRNRTPPAPEVPVQPPAPRNPRTPSQPPSGTPSTQNPSQFPTNPDGVRPSGTPNDWIPQPTKKPGGIEWVDPKNPQNRDRWMPGNPDSPYPNSRAPYFRRQRHGQWHDRLGRPVPTTSPDGHIPMNPDWTPPELPLVWP